MEKKCPIKKVENIILKKKLLTKKNLDKISNNMQLKINNFLLKQKSQDFQRHRLLIIMFINNEKFK